MAPIPMRKTIIYSFTCTNFPVFSEPFQFLAHCQKIKMSVMRAVIIVFSFAMITGLPEISQYSKVRSEIENMSRRQEVLSHLNSIEAQVYIF